LDPRLARVFQSPARRDTKAQYLGDLIECLASSIIDSSAD
jgi:hypothetical protein